MKKIIDNRRFDTEKAHLIYEWSDGLPEDNDAHFTETLFRKLTGEYFLYGKGGANSRYAKMGKGPKIGSFTAGDDFIPLSRSQARAWAERHMSAESVAAEFVDADADKLVNIQFRLTAEEREKLRFYALSCGISISDVLREYIEQLPEVDSY